MITHGLTLEENITIEEILTEANAYGLKAEVQDAATVFLKEGHGFVDSYSMAFNDWCK
jgi:hypothetical protein|tara:strand:+ start:235 stop:408 length:174 start_codon:yes stop_codon:yes gene_type:complete